MEQTAAAAASLEQQALVLRRAVSVFQISQAAQAAIGQASDSALLPGAAVETLGHPWQVPMLT